MQKVQVIGITTKKVYVEGETKRECLRKLNKKYPNFYEVTEERKGRKVKMNNQLYPEALIII